MSIETFFTDKLLPFLQKLIDILLSPINNAVIKIFPDYNEFITMINQFLYYVTQPINYILDMSFISSITWTYLLTSIIFRVSSKLIVYTVKLFVKWWSALT